MRASSTPPGTRGGYEEATDVEVVPIHRRGRVHAGVNLVVSGHAPQAFLVDMDGKPLHSWQCELKTVWRGFTDFKEGYDAFWRRAYVYPNGDLLAIFDGIGIFKLSRDSKNVPWQHRDGEHHDIFVDEGGTIYTLSRREIGEARALEARGPDHGGFHQHPLAPGRADPAHLRSRLLARLRLRLGPRRRAPPG